MENNNTEKEKIGKLTILLFLGQLLSAGAIIFLVVKVFKQQNEIAELSTSVSQIREGKFEHLTARSIDVIDDVGRVRMLINADNTKASLIARDADGRDRFILTSKQGSTSIEYFDQSETRAVLLDEDMGANGLNVFYENSNIAASVVTSVESGYQDGAVIDVTSKEKEYAGGLIAKHDEALFSLIERVENEKQIYMSVSKRWEAEDIFSQSGIYLSSSGKPLFHLGESFAAEKGALVLGGAETGRFFETALNNESGKPYLAISIGDYFTRLASGEGVNSFATGIVGNARVGIGLAEWGPYINLLDQTGRVRLRAVESFGGSAFETFGESGDLSGRILQENSKASLEIYDGDELIINVPKK